MAMILEGEERIEAPVDEVWQALNDPEILFLSIPGCESLEKLSENQMAATITIKIGPIKARFAGQVVLSKLNPPHSYTISGEGRGGVAGSAKGTADVVLEVEGPAVTLLRYKCDADVRGKIAQLGSRLIRSTSNKLTKQFFSNFGQNVCSK